MEKKEFWRKDKRKNTYCDSELRMGLFFDLENAIRTNVYSSFVFINFSERD